MTDYLVDGSNLTAIANAIRTKGGTSASLEFPQDFIDAIDAITTGGTYQAKTNISPTESSQTITPDDGYDALSSVQINAVSSSYVGSAIDRRDSSDLSASGATVTAPAGYYSSAASKAVSSGTEGTPTATKGTVSNHSVSVTPSVTNTTGYITGSTKTGTAVTVSASELVSGSETKTANGTYDVTNLAQLIVNVSGSGGLVYETGTYTPTSNTARPTINFTNTHSTPPMFFIFADSGTGSASDSNTNQANIYGSWNTAFGADILPSGASTHYYALAAYIYGTSRSDKYISSLTGTSSNEQQGYWATNTNIRPSSASTSRYWKSGRSYKWIAVWAPTT